jgi:hypothetical protein
VNPELGPLYVPRRVRVDVDPEGSPCAVEGIPVESIREAWLVEDRWWAPKPLRRRYFELVLADGRDVTVFRSGDGRWYRQRA